LELNLTGIRQQLLDLRSWSASGTKLLEKLRTGINLALNRLCLDAPSAFFPDVEHAVLLSDVVSGDSTGYLVYTTDNWVLSFTDSTGLALPTSWVPTLDGTWAGIYHLEFKDENGVWHRRQTREFWGLYAGGGVPTAYLVSLDRPVVNAGVYKGVLEFRLHQPRFYTRDDVLRLDSCMVWDSNGIKAYPVSAGSADLLNLRDYQGDSNGLPLQIINAEHFQLPAPNYVPTATEGEQGTWLGPENMGKFRVKYTVVRGRRDVEWQESEGLAIADPQWESAPSEYVEIEHTRAGALVFQLPNIDWQLSFDTPGTLRQTRSGHRIRIYVARLDVQVGGAGLEPNVESAGIYYALAEVDGSTTFYSWDGSVTPDYSRRLRHSTGYYAWAVFPHQDARYELDLRVARKVEDLEVGNDTPRVKPQAIPAFTELCLYYACLKDGVDMVNAQVHLENYKEMLSDVKAELSNRTKVVAPMSWAGELDASRRRYGTFELA